MLGVGQSNDSADSVRRAKLVRNVKLLETQDFYASARQMINSGAAHAADTHHDDIINHVGARSSYCGCTIPPLRLVYRDRVLKSPLGSARPVAGRRRAPGRADGRLAGGTKPG